MSLELVLATHNAHKVVELQAILSGAIPGLTVRGYDGPEPVENGVSFAENALIKARAASAHTGAMALADDSGICVDVMGGAPGIFSARWAGGHGDSVANYELLLDQLLDIATGDRSAVFNCTIALVLPARDGEEAREFVVEGEWPGRVATAPGGSNGFGYDPIFIPEGFDVVAADLDPQVKNEHSHRSRAIAELLPILLELAAEELGAVPAD